MSCCACFLVSTAIAGVQQRTTWSRVDCSRAEQSKHACSPQCSPTRLLLTCLHCNSRTYTHSTDGQVARTEWERIVEQQRMTNGDWLASGELTARESRDQNNGHRMCALHTTHGVESTDVHDARLLLYVVFAALPFSPRSLLLCCFHLPLSLLPCPLLPCACQRGDSRPALFYNSSAKGEKKMQTRTAQGRHAATSPSQPCDNGTTHCAQKCSHTRQAPHNALHAHSLDDVAWCDVQPLLLNEAVDFRVVLW